MYDQLFQQHKQAIEFIIDFDEDLKEYKDAPPYQNIKDAYEAIFSEFKTNWQDMSDDDIAHFVFLIFSFELYLSVQFFCQFAFDQSGYAIYFENMSLPDIMIALETVNVTPVPSDVLMELMLEVDKTRKVETVVQYYIDNYNYIKEKQGGKS